MAKRKTKTPPKTDAQIEAEEELRKWAENHAATIAWHANNSGLLQDDDPWSDYEITWNGDRPVLTVNIHTCVVIEDELPKFYDEDHEDLKSAVDDFKAMQDKIAEIVQLSPA